MVGNSMLTVTNLTYSSHKVVKYYSPLEMKVGTDSIEEIVIFRCLLQPI